MRSHAHANLLPLCTGFGLKIEGNRKEPLPTNYWVVTLKSSFDEQRTRLGLAMATDTPNEKTLIEAFSIIENTPEIELAIAKLRDLLNIDHIVYHTSKFGAS